MSVLRKAFLTLVFASMLLVVFSASYLLSVVFPSRDYGIADSNVPYVVPGEYSTVRSLCMTNNRGRPVLYFLLPDRDQMLSVLDNYLDSCSQWPYLPKEGILLEILPADDESLLLMVYGGEEVGNLLINSLNKGRRAVNALTRGLGWFFLLFGVLIFLCILYLVICRRIFSGRPI